MTIFWHEIRRGRKSLLIWSLSVGFMIFLCLMLYPQMEGQMEDVSQLFAGMGGFTEAFGMDKIGFGTVMGFYGIECGNILGIGGACFAAATGIALLAKEEKEHTAEFLFSHPVLRQQVMTQKILSALVQIFVFNLFAILIALISFGITQEQPEYKELFLLHAAFFLMQLEIFAVCFALSAVIKRGNYGIGFGIAIGCYFMNLVGNITEEAEALKYITPFGYADASQIISEGQVSLDKMGIGVLIMLLGIFFSYWYYGKKDLAA